MATNKERKAIPLGVVGAPWPTRIHNESNGVATHELGVIESQDRALPVYSSRSPEEVYCSLYREMPVPSHLELLEKILLRAAPDNPNRIVRIVSNPGMGKTYLGNLIGKVMDARGSEYASVALKSMESVLFDTAIERQQRGGMLDQLDQALADGSLSEISLSRLRGLGGKDGVLIEADGQHPTLDRAAFDALDQALVDNAFQSICRAERWDSGDLGVSFTTVKGALVKADEQGKPVVVIDELEKCKLGTETILNPVLQVFNGEVEEYTAKLGNSGSHTFRRGEVPLIITTENLAKDGGASTPLADSFVRRAKEYRLPDFNEEDWQHRICQKLTGLPISTLHRIESGRMEGVGAAQHWKIDDPAKFTKTLLAIRTGGLSDDARANIPNHQLEMIRQWPKVLEVSARLAALCHKWTDLNNPESALLKSSAMSDVRHEVDDMDNPVEPFTPSDMLELIDEALIAKPQKKRAERSGGFSPGSWEQPSSSAVVAKGESLLPIFGDRLAEELSDKVYRSAGVKGKKHLEGQLKQLVHDAGFSSANRVTADLLNMQPTKVVSGDEMAADVRSQLVRHLKDKHPELQDAKTDDIISLAQVQATLKSLGGEKNIELAPNARVFHVVNDDPNSFQQSPLKRVVVQSLSEGEGEAIFDRLTPDKLITPAKLAASLAMPVAGKLSMQALWNTSLSSASGKNDEATRVAQHQSDSGVGITSIVCQGDDGRYAKLHVVHNQKSGKALVVGPKLDDDLVGQLGRNNITYVDVDSRQAKSAVSSALDNLATLAAQKQLSAAFRLRNEVQSGFESSDLPELLTKAEASVLAVPSFATALSPQELNYQDRVSGGGLRGLIGGRGR